MTDNALFPGLTEEDGFSAPMAANGGALDAASVTAAEFFNWDPAIRSADAEILPNSRRAKARARDLARNDPVIAGMRRNHIDVVVGDQFRLNLQPVLDALGNGFDEKWKSEFKREVEARFMLVAESQNCDLDAEGTKTFMEMIRLAESIGFTDGNACGAFEWIEEAGRSCSTAFKFVSTDRVSNPYDAMDTDNIRGGIELDFRGKPVAYHVRNSHPSDINRVLHDEPYTWSRVPRYNQWGRIMFLHAYHQLSAEQTQGIAMITAALREAKQLRNFSEISLQAIVAAASWLGYVESNLPPEKVMEIVGAGGVGGVNGGENKMFEAVDRYYKQHMAMVGRFASGKDDVTRVNGLKMPVLPPNTKMSVQHLGKDNNLGSTFDKSVMRRISAALGFTYEETSRDFSDVNYATIKAGLRLTQRGAASNKRICADKFANGIFRNWLEEMILTNRINSLPRSARRVGWVYEAGVMDALSHCTWIGGSFGQIDEMKETQAANIRIRMGISTQEREAAKMGLDWEDVLRQRARELKMKKDLEKEFGVAFDEEKKGASQAALTRNPKSS